jgi:hypothetical protein
VKYRVDLLFDSDMDEEDFAIWLEDTLYSVSTSRAAVTDLHVYVARDLPSFAEQVRREHERRVVGEERKQ